LDKNKIWGTTLNFLRDNNTSLSYNTWLAPLTIHHIEEDAGIIYLAWPNQAKLITHINDHYLTQIENALNSSTDKKYRVVIKPDKEYEITKIDTSRMKNTFNQEKLFNPRFNFENFIVGNSNKYAHAVSVAVAESPGDIYNPLFIYGGSGLGKTHLMQSIGVHIIRNNPQSKVLYVSSEMFTTEFIFALEHRKVEEFKNKYRNIDVLLMDDIQFLSNKESLQNEFFYTFNALHELGKQIVVSSDRPINELSTLEERIRTRFSWGLIVDVQAPDFETKIAILNKKSYEKDINFSQDVLDYIARHTGCNVRELEGILNYILMFKNQDFMDNSHKNITINVVKDALRHLQSNATTEITPKIIIDVVSRYFNISVDDIMSGKRNKEIALPRQIAMYFCRILTDYSFPEIGDFFNGKNHTTIMHGYNKINDMASMDADLRATLDDIESTIVSA